jgi:hypothetical protein
MQHKSSLTINLLTDYYKYNIFLSKEEEKNYIYVLCEENC